MHWIALLAMVLSAIVLGGAGRGDAGTAIVVLSSNASPYLQAEQAIAETLASRGHAVRFMAIDDATGPALQRFVDGGIGSFVAIGGDAAVTLRRRLPEDMPLSFCMVADAEALGLTPLQNAYGVSADVPFAVQIGLIAEALPRARKIGMLYRSGTMRSARLKTSVEAELPPGWALVAIDVDANQSVAQAIESLLSREIDIVWTAADSSVYDDAAVRSLLLAAVRRRVPVFGFSPAFVRAGALLGVGVDPASQGRQVAEIAQRLLDTNEPPAETSQPHHQIAINLTVAEMLSIELPRELVRRADHVIQPE